MKFLIIGLGNYGKSLAVELTTLGHEVIGADNKATNVDNIKNSIAMAYTIDATDHLSLTALPLKSVDIVIVAIGENFGASVKIVAMLKQHGVKSIYARAIDDMHKAILEAFSITHILTPEYDSALRFVHSFDFGVKVDNFSVDSEHYVVKIEVPKKFVGYGINTLRLKDEFDISIIAVTRINQAKNFLSASTIEDKVEANVGDDYIMSEGDKLVCYGSYKAFQKLWKALL